MKKLLCVLTAAILCFGGLTGCGNKTPNFPVDIGGAHLTKKPTAIVGLSPYVDEILYGLQKSDLLVGRSEYDAFNGNVRSLPSCGTVTAPDIDKILALKPQIIVSATALPEEAQTKLKAANIQLCVLAVPKDVYEVAQRVTQVAALTVGNNRAATLANDYLKKFNDELQYVKSKLGATTPKTAVFILSADGAVATGDTLIGSVMSICGLKNIAADKTDYTMKASDILAADPEVVIVSNPPSIEELMKNPVLGQLSQVKAGKTFEIDNQFVECYTPSITNLIYGLAYAVYPDQMATPDTPVDSGSSVPSRPDISVPVTQGK